MAGETIKRYAQRLNFEVERGSTFDKTIVWKQPDGTPVDLTGKGARMMVRPDFESAAFISMSDSDPVGSPRIELGGTAGTIRLIIPAASTEAIVPDSGVYDLEIFETPVGSTEEVVTKLLFGNMKFLPEVTRP